MRARTGRWTRHCRLPARTWPGPCRPTSGAGTGSPCSATASRRPSGETLGMMRLNCMIFISHQGAGESGALFPMYMLHARPARRTTPNRNTARRIGTNYGGHRHYTNAVMVEIHCPTCQRKGRYLMKLLMRQGRFTRAYATQCNARGCFTNSVNRQIQSIGQNREFQSLN